MSVIIKLKLSLYALHDGITLSDGYLTHIFIPTVTYNLKTPFKGKYSGDIIIIRDLYCGYQQSHYET